MSNDLPILTSLTENSTDLPVSTGRVENYVLLLVLLCVFAGGTLVLLSLLLLFCHRCCVGGRRYSRASDDPEKTNTTYVEDSQPTQEITIRLDESDAASTTTTSCHDGETERFLSTGSTGRRVSFNESALYEEERKNQEKGRRYTLTEGDFHHLKKARLTHLHLAPPPSALKILTIMECESAASSTMNINEPPAPKPPLVIYQLPERGVPPASNIWLGQSLSGGLPGDPHHSILLDQGPPQKLPVLKPQHTHTRNLEAIGDRGEGEREMKGGRGMSPPPSPTPVLQFFSKLRRHASLEGAGPYFKKWKFDSGHRAASLDAKGSPKRKPFQRQRAASETTDHTEEDFSPLSNDVPQDFPHNACRTSNLQPLSAGSLFHAASPPSPSGSLRRLEVEAVVEAEVSTSSTEADRTQPPSGHPEAQQREVETGQRREAAPGAEDETQTETEAAEDSADVWVRPGEEEGGEIPFGAGDRRRDAAESREDGGEYDGAEGMLLTAVEGPGREEGERGIGATSGAERPLGAEARTGSDSGSPLHCFGRRESGETATSLYRDIWSLRASLEQYASSDQSSTDRESIRSDADSVCSLGGAGTRSGCLSQDLDDEPEREGEEADGGDRGASGGDAESGSNAGGGEGEAGSRKLLQMDSGYASIEAPSRAPEELRLFGAPGCPRGKSASERRLFFTSSRRKGSVCESFEARVFQEELEEETADGAEAGDKPLERGLLVRLPASQEPAHLLVSLHPQKPLDPLQLQLLQSQPTSPPLHPPPPLPQPSPHRPRLRRRDYSIDEKTDALFSEFLRHDPRFDQEDSPLRSRHRSRVHLRKQWQRHKQYSDPGAGAGGRYSPSLERQRFSPLRRGDSAGYPLDTRYHSTLSRIASAADEEASETAAGGGAACAEAAGNKETEEDATVGLAGASEEGTSTSSMATTQAVGSEGLASRSCDTLSAPGGMDPRVDNRNNNSSQAILSEMASSILSTQKPSAPFPKPLRDYSPVPLAPTHARPILKPQSSLTDKLAVTLEERLFSGLRTGQHLGKGQAGLEAVVTVSHTSSPDRSPT
ncbi:voltage-dependent calcium channel beta subunit-associated regulatory protein [Aplochiton taeniatus]